VQFGLVNGIFVLARCFESRRGLVRTLINTVGFTDRTKNGAIPLPQHSLHSKVRTVKIVLTVCFFKTESGNEPVRQWLRGLDPLDRKTIGEDVKTVQIGWPLGMPLVRKLGRALREIRITLPRRIARILFTVVGAEIVLLHGFIKKSQATPQEELELAQGRLHQLRDS
jgi:phage-related protein